MLTLPEQYGTLIATFAPVFAKRLWARIQVLLVGGILIPGQRTVAAVLRVMGLSNDKHFQNYHRLLNRAVWSSLALSKALLALLSSTFAATGTIVMGLDDTIERRRGAKIKAKGIYRDPVRSSHGHFVKASAPPCASRCSPPTWPITWSSVASPSARRTGWWARWCWPASSAA